MTEKAIKQRKSGEAYYESIFGDVARIVETARRSAARSVNYIMTAAYWLVGRRIVEFEQAGSAQTVDHSCLKPQDAKGRSSNL
jgi:hypothetical protein